VPTANEDSITCERISFAKSREKSFSTPTDDGIKSSFTLSYAISRLGTIAALNQDRTAVYHNGLSSTESFLHQEQIGLRYVMSLADSANRETLSYAFV
jgi:hypothetical protein